MQLIAIFYAEFFFEKQTYCLNTQTLLFFPQSSTVSVDVAAHEGVYMNLVVTFLFKWYESCISIYCKPCTELLHARMLKVSAGSTEPSPALWDVRNSFAPDCHEENDYRTVLSVNSGRSGGFSLCSSHCLTVHAA